MDGWIILDKPEGITSAHAVAKIKRIVKPKKIGHAGTLDPLASGILPLALGEGTKTVPYMMDAEKFYSFEVTWGEERDTDDRAGAVVNISKNRPSRADIEAILPQFTGKISQIPPDYSAIKVDGQRAYDAARGGEALELKAREITVHSLEMIDYAADKATFMAHCGKGTYIRSLARDMGRVLGGYGYISKLRRTCVGKFDEAAAISLEKLEEMMHKGDLGFLRTVESALDDIPALELDSNQAMLLKRGQFIPVPASTPQTVRTRSEGKLVAIGEVSGGLLKPVRVFNL